LFASQKKYRSTLQSAKLARSKGVDQAKSYCNRKEAKRDSKRSLLRDFETAHSSGVKAHHRGSQPLATVMITGDRLQHVARTDSTSIPKERERARKFGQRLQRSGRRCQSFFMEQLALQQSRTLGDFCQGVHAAAAGVATHCVTCGPRGNSAQQCGQVNRENNGTGAPRHRATGYAISCFNNRRQHLRNTFGRETSLDCLVIEQSTRRLDKERDRAQRFERIIRFEWIIRSAGGLLQFFGGQRGGRKDQIRPQCQLSRARGAIRLHAVERRQLTEEREVPLKIVA
jgi:hypothetical protein